MNIVVCIKQVPDTDDVKIDSETNTLIRKGVQSIINPYDMNAIEAGIQLRKKFDGKVTVISMGPSQVKDSLKDAISLGVDEVILLSDRAFAGADTWATSYTLAKGIEKIGDVDLILCGKQAIDGDTGQVGPGIAEQLNLPHITYVKDIVDASKNEITVKRKIENGFSTIEMKLPGLLTVVKDINEPRLPSIRGILRAREIEVPVWTAEDLDTDEDFTGLDGSPTQVVSCKTPEIDVEAKMFEGKAEKQVDGLLAELRQQEIF